MKLKNIMKDLKPHYVSTDKGSIYTNISLYEKNNEIHIICGLDREIKFVRECTTC